MWDMTLKETSLKEKLNDLYNYSQNGFITFDQLEIQLIKLEERILNKEFTIEENEG